MRHVLSALVLVALALAGVTAAAPLPGAPNCMIFTRWNDWNQRIDSLPVTANSSAIIASIGVSGHLHPDFGPGL